jgi:hypothetical protein
MQIRILSTAAFLVVATALVAQEPALTQNSSFFANINGIVVADLADDSRPAVIGIEGSGFGSSVVVLKNLGNGKYGPPTYYPVTGYLTGIAVGDFNGDGKLDVAAAIGVFGGSDGKVAILRGKGDTTLEKPVYYTVPLPPNSIAVADFNNDNLPDIAVIGFSSDNATNTVTILTNTGSSFTEHSFAAPTTFTTVYSYPDNDQIIDLVEGDFNGDGRIDLAYIDSCQQCDPQQEQPYIFENLASGWKGYALDGGGGSGTLSMTAADIDGDGITDLVIPWHGCHTPCVGVTVLYMDKNFSVAKSLELSNPNGYYGPVPQQVVVGDFNNDGITDVAGFTHGGLDQNQNQIPANIAVWTGAGNRTFNNVKYYNQSPPSYYGEGGYTAAGFLTSYPGRGLIVPDLIVDSDAQVWKNSTTEAHDPCPYPTAESGIHVCEPAEVTPRGTVQFLASARSSVQPLNRIELWVDGKKEVQIFADRLHFEMPLANGKHTAGFFEIGASGLKTEKRVEFTVGK